MSKPKRICSNCAHYSSMGKCRRFLPIFIGKDSNGNPIFRLPTANRSDSCGKHRFVDGIS